MSVYLALKVAAGKNKTDADITAVFAEGEVCVKGSYKSSGRSIKASFTYVRMLFSQS